MHNRLLTILTFWLMSLSPSDAWHVWVQDGKTGGTDAELIPTTNILEHYFENLQKVDGNKWSARNPDDFKAENGVWADIGVWAGYKVIDVTFPAINHKTIMLLDAAGNYRLLYAQFKHSTAHVDDFPRIRRIGGQDVLIYRTRIPGTGHFFIEEYWVYDSTTDCPVSVNTTSIGSEFAKLFPQGYGVWKGGGLNFEELKYSSGVWKKGDGNCCPTGGRIDMTFALVGTNLVVKTSKYDAAFDWYK